MYVCVCVYVYVCVCMYIYGCFVRVCVCVCVYVCIYVCFVRVCVCMVCGGYDIGCVEGNTFSECSVVLEVLLQGCWKIACSLHH